MKKKYTPKPLPSYIEPDPSYLHFDEELRKYLFREDGEWKLTKRGQEILEQLQAKEKQNEVV